MFKLTLLFCLWAVLPIYSIQFLLLINWLNSHQNFLPALNNQLKPFFSRLSFFDVSKPRILRCIFKRRYGLKCRRRELSNLHDHFQVNFFFKLSRSNRSVRAPYSVLCVSCDSNGQTFYYCTLFNISLTALGLLRAGWHHALCLCDSLYRGKEAGL